MKTAIFAILLIGMTSLSCAIETIEVKAYRANDETPVSFQDINRETLDSKNATVEPSFLLSKTPSVTQYSDSGSYQGYSYMRLRGMDQTRINMTLDSVPLNEPEDQGVYFSNYPGILGSLESIQVQRGVGISQNGTASFAGSIQLQSVDLSRPREAQVEAGAGSFGTRHAIGKYLSGTEDGRGAFVQVSTVHSDGYKYHSGNDSQSLFASGISEDESGAWRIAGFKGSQSNELAWLGVSQQAIDEDPRTNGNTQENDHFEQSLIYASRQQVINEHLRDSVILYYNSLNGNYDFDLNNYLGLPPTNELLNYAFHSKFYGLISIADYQMGAADWSAGIHISDYERTHIGSDNETGRLFKNTGYRNNFSGFVKNTYQLSDWNLFANIQYRKTDFDYSGTVSIPTMTWTFVNPTVGINYQLNNNTNIYYSLGRTGREPTRTDLFGGNENLELKEDGTPNLFVVKPEYVIDHELGFRFRDNTFNSSINFFYMDFSHEITLNGQIGANGLPLNQDVDKSIRKGIELSNNIKINSQLDMTFSASLSRSQISDQHQTEQQVLSPREIINVGFNYNWSRLTFGVATRYESSAYLDLANTQTLNSYTVFDSYISYSVRNFEARVQINNIFNKVYSSSGMVDANGDAKYFIAPPLNAYSSVRVRF